MSVRKRFSDQDLEKYLVAFRHFDKNGDGFISMEEFNTVMSKTKAGSKLSEKDLQEMVAEADKDNDGQINYQEFVDMIKKIWNRYSNDLGNKRSNDLTWKTKMSVF